MGNCLGTEEKQKSYPPSQQDLNASQNPSGIVSPNSVDIHLSNDHSRPLPSTPKAKGESEWENVFCQLLYFYTPISIDWGHIVFGLSVCPLVCLEKLVHWLQLLNGK